MSPIRLLLAAATLGGAGFLIHRELNPPPEFCECCYRPVNSVSEVLGPERVRAGTDDIRLLGVDTEGLTETQKQAVREAIEDWIREFDEVVALINEKDLPSQQESDGCLPAWLMDSRTKAIFNVDLARRGLVRVRLEPYDHLFFSKPMLDAEQEAKAAGRGIWGS